MESNKRAKKFEQRFSDSRKGEVIIKANLDLSHRASNKEINVIKIINFLIKSNVKVDKLRRALTKLKCFLQILSKQIDV